MDADTECLKKDFLVYLHLLVLPSAKLLVEKIQPLQNTKLKEIKFQSDSEKKLSITSKNINVILEDKKLESYGFSIRDFKRSIEAIKDEDENSEKLLCQAIEEVINLNNVKLYKSFITSAILIYTQFYEKSKLKHPNFDKYKIYDLIDKDICASLSDNCILSIHNYFNRAYREYERSTGFIHFFGNETENLKIIFNITKELKSNFTPYQKSYTTLINLIETFVIYAEDKGAAKILIDELKYYTNCSFSTLIQISSENQQNKKTVIENFKLAAEKLIKNYIEDHPCECKKQQNILNYVLWFITKIIPKSVFPKEKRISLFGKYTETGREIKNLTEQIIEKATNLVY